VYSRIVDGRILRVIHMHTYRLVFFLSDYLVTKHHQGLHSYLHLGVYISYNISATLPSIPVTMKTTPQDVLPESNTQLLKQLPKEN